jgi:exodeoxyribonuclease VIII
VQVEPGIYYDVPFSEYLTWNAVSNSRLGLAARSAAHFKQGFGDETSPALRLGSLTHCGVLEPLQLSNRYVVEPNFAGMPENVDKKGERSFSHATTFVKEARKQFAEANSRKTVVSQAEYDKTVGIATSLHKEASVRALMSQGNSEVSLAWIDYATGLACKCRVDWLTIAGSHIRIVDLKTCRDPLRFESSIAEYGYHRQMAFYRRGIDAIFNTRADAWLIAVETESPFCSRTAKVSESALRKGDDEVSELLDLVAECRALDAWPGYTSPAEWELPAWKMRQNDDVLVEVGDDI